MMVGAEQEKRRLTHPNSKSFCVSEEFRKAEGFAKGSRRYISCSRLIALVSPSDLTRYQVLPLLDRLSSHR
jgi:hypothetical protein